MQQLEFQKELDEQVRQKKMRKEHEKERQRAMDFRENERLRRQRAEMQMAYESEGKGDGGARRADDSSSGAAPVTFAPPKTMKAKQGRRRQQREDERVEQVQVQARVEAQVVQTAAVNEQGEMKPRWGATAAPTASSSAQGTSLGILQQMGINDLGPGALLRRELNDEQDMLRKQVREQERIIGNLRAELDFSADSHAGLSLSTFASLRFPTLCAICSSCWSCTLIAFDSRANSMCRYAFGSKQRLPSRRGSKSRLSGRRQCFRATQNLSFPGLGQKFRPCSSDVAMAIVQQ